MNRKQHRRHLREGWFNARQIGFGEGEMPLVESNPVNVVGFLLPCSVECDSRVLGASGSPPGGGITGTSKACREQKADLSK